MNIVTTSYLVPHTDWWIVIPTWLLALATIALFFFTLRLWKSTSKLVDITHDNSKKELRAYIGVDEHNNIQRRHIDGKEHGVEGMYRIFATAQITNHGKTPAIGVTFSPTKMALMDNEPSESKFPKMKYDGNGTIQPGQTSDIRFGADATREQWEALKINANKILAGESLYVFGWVTYFDVFGSRHFTRYCFCIYYLNGIENPPAWDYCSQFNDTDDKPNR